MEPSLPTLVAALGERPVCKCHGQSMLKSGRKPDGSQKFICAVTYHRRRRRWLDDPAMRERINAKRRERYYSLSGFAYNRLLLKQRRNKALGRIRERSERGPLQA